MAADSSVAIRTHSPSYQAYQVLHIAFVVAPLVAGLDKFFGLLANWEAYLSPLISRVVPAHTFMMGVGVIEIVAALIVLVRPLYGAWIVAAWLFGIILNLLSIPAYFDIALRDLGLALGAIALARLAAEYDVRA